MDDPLAGSERKSLLGERSVSRDAIAIVVFGAEQLLFAELRTVW